MVLEETNKIDITREKDGNILLGIVDAGITTDPKIRLNKLIQKLRVYLRFLASNKFKTHQPQFDPKKAIIMVWCETKPTIEMKKIKFFGLKDENGKEILKVTVGILDVSSTP